MIRVHGDLFATMRIKMHLDPDQISHDTRQVCRDKRGHPDTSASDEILSFLVDIGGRFIIRHGELIFFHCHRPLYILLNSQRKLIHDPAMVESYVDFDHGHQDVCKYPLLNYLSEKPDHVLQVNDRQRDRQDVED